MNNNEKHVASGLNAKTIGEVSRIQRPEGVSMLRETYICYLSSSRDCIRSLKVQFIFLNTGTSGSPLRTTFTLRSSIRRLYQCVCWYYVTSLLGDPALARSARQSPQSKNSDNVIMYITHLRERWRISVEKWIDSRERTSKGLEGNVASVPLHVHGSLMKSPESALWERSV